MTADSPPAAFGGQLDQDLRRDLDNQRKIFLWSAGGGSDFAVLRVRR